MSKYKIFVVDDNRSLRQVLVELLKLNGYQTKGFPSGEAALEHLDEFDPDVALLDVKMDGISGIELLAEIKKRKPEIVCILLSAHASREDAIEAMNLGAYSFLGKPYDNGRLLLTIRRGIEHREARLALQESEQRYRLLAETAPDLICIHDMEGKITYLNQAALTFTGFSREEIGKKTVRDFVISSHLDALEARYQNRLAGHDGKLRYQAELINAEGKCVPVEINSATILEQGEVKAVLIIARDITEREDTQKALQESEEKYRDLVENINEVIYAVDTNGIITYISPTVEPMGEYVPSELIGRSLTDFVYPDDLPDVMERFRKRLTGQLKPYEYRLLTKSGKIRWVRSASRLIEENGKVVGLRGSLINITKRKRAERNVEERNRRLQALYLAGWQMSRTLDLEQIFANIHKIIVQAMPCDSMIVSSYDEREQKISCQWGIGPYGPIDVAKLPPLPLNPEGEGTQSKAIITGDAFYFRDYQEQRKTSKKKYYIKPDSEIAEKGEQPADGRVPQSALVVPLKLENRTLGVIQVFSLELDAFTQDDLNFLEALGPQIAVAMANARLYQQAQEEITERQLAEDKLKAYSEQLERRVQARTVQLRERVDEVEQLNKTMVHLLTDLEETNERLQQTSQQLAEANRRLTEERIEEQTALLNLSQALLGEHEIEPIAEQIVSTAANALGVELSALLLFDHRENTYRAVASIGWSDGNQEIDYPIVSEPDDAVGHVIRNKEALRIADLRTDQFSAPDFVHQQGVRARLLVPVLYEGKAIGCLVVNRCDPHTWTDDEVRLLTLIANSAAQALEQARLFEAESLRRQEAETLSEATSVLVSTIELEAMLDSILEQLEMIIEFDSASVMLVENDGLKVVAWKNLPRPEDVIGKRFPLDDPLFKQMQHSGRALILDDVQYANHFDGWGGTGDIATWMATPLIVRGDVIGYITFDSHRPGVFADREASLSQAFANQAAAAVQNARLYQAETRRRKLAETMRQVVQVIGASLELDVILKTLLEQLKNVLDYDTTSILVASDQDHWDMVVSRGYDDEAMVIQKAKKMTLKSPILRQMAEDLEPVIISDVREQEEWIWVPGAEHVRSFMAVPFVARGRMVGVLMVDSVHVDRYDRSDLETAQILVQHVAQAIDNALLFKQVRNNQRRLESLSRQLVQAQENERRALARELHDQVGQSLTAVKLNLQTLQRVAKDAGMANELNSSVEIADRALQRIRNLSLNLRPTVLDDFGLEAALEWYLERQAIWFDLDISLGCELTAERLSPEMETTCFRIAQSALTNAARHAEAEHVQVSVRVEDQKTLVLSVEDDGVGFDVQTAMRRASQGDSLGLLSMQDRAEQLGGRLSISSRPGEGTKVQVHLPLVGTGCLDEV